MQQDRREGMLKKSPVLLRPLPHHQSPVRRDSHSLIRNNVLVAVVRTDMVAEVSSRNRMTALAAPVFGRVTTAVISYAVTRLILFTVFVWILAVTFTATLIYATSIVLACHCVMKLLREMKKQWWQQMSLATTNDQTREVFFYGSSVTVFKVNLTWTCWIATGSISRIRSTWRRSYVAALQDST
jgi:hypothetical protein